MPYAEIGIGRRSLTARGVDRRKLIDIEDLVAWTYRDQKAHIVEDRGVGLISIELESAAAAAGWHLTRTSQDGVAACARVGLLGGFVDGGGYTSGDLHPDAEKVHTAVRKLGEWGYLLLQYGRTGSRPDEWRSAEAYLEPEWIGAPCRDRNGLPVVRTFRVEFWDNHRKKPRLCPLRLVKSDPRYIVEMREIYRKWWHGLKALAEGFAADPSALRSNRVIGPRVPETPWETRVARQICR